MMRRTLDLPSLRLLLAVVGLLATVHGVSKSAEPASQAAKIAAQILDGSRPDAERRMLAEESANNSADLIQEMAKGLESQPDLKEEYRRIPWIWRVAIAAGKRNQDNEIRRILEASLPLKGAKLHDWQAVVIGGGIINGISLSGGWPSERLSAIVANDASLRERWLQVQDQASVMSDDTAVFKGTRYDALRILGVGTWDRRGAQIFRYLLRGVDDELQMGAISALSDMKSPCIGQVLLSGITIYSAKNREMAFDALIREDSRILELLLAVEDGRLTASQVGEARVAQLKKVADPALRARVEKTLGSE